MPHRVCRTDRDGVELTAIHSEDPAPKKNGAFEIKLLGYGKTTQAGAIKVLRDRYNLSHHDADRLVCPSVPHFNYDLGHYVLYRGSPGKIVKVRGEKPLKPSGLLKEE